jgi:hypothetical protein
LLLARERLDWGVLWEFASLELGMGGLCHLHPLSFLNWLVVLVILVLLVGMGVVYSVLKSVDLGVNSLHWRRDR